MKAEHTTIQKKSTHDMATQTYATAGFINTKAGFTLFMAVLVASLLAALGAAIFNLSFKQVIFSSSARNSEIALYAADTAMECALYWDLQQQAFRLGESPNLNCAGTTISQIVNDSSGIVRREFSINAGTLCADVQLERDPVSSTGVFDAQGYNTCNENDPRRIQRALRVEYRPAS